MNCVKIAGNAMALLGAVEETSRTNFITHRVPEFGAFYKFSQKKVEEMEIGLYTDANPGDNFHIRFDNLGEVSIFVGTQN